MTDTMLPIIRQMLDAEDDAARARILLNVPDLVLAKYRETFEQACRRARFDAGEEYITVRLATLLAVRDDMGNLPRELALAAKSYRAEMVIATGWAGGEHG